MHSYEELSVGGEEWVKNVHGMHIESEMKWRRCLTHMCPMHGHALHLDVLRPCLSLHTTPFSVLPLSPFPCILSIPSLVLHRWHMSQVLPYSVTKRGTPTSSEQFPLSLLSRLGKEFSLTTLSGLKWHTLLRMNTSSPV